MKSNLFSLDVSHNKHFQPVQYQHFCAFRNLNILSKYLEEGYRIYDIIAVDTIYDDEQVLFDKTKVLHKVDITDLFLDEHFPLLITNP